MFFNPDFAQQQQWGVQVVDGLKPNKQLFLALYLRGVLDLNEIAIGRDFEFQA